MSFCAGPDRVVVLGLELESLDRFKAKPLDTFIPILAGEIDATIGINLFSARSRSDAVRMVMPIVAYGAQMHWKPVVNAFCIIQRMPMLAIGLTLANLRHLHANPLSAYLAIEPRKEVPFTVRIFSGHSAEDMKTFIKDAGFTLPLSQLTSSERH